MEAHEHIPISLDAQAGLAVVDALGAQAVAPHHSTLAEPTVQILQSIATNPAATQETRDRIAMLARFGLIFP